MRKGSAEWVTVLLSFMVVLLLIVAIAPFLAEATVSTSINVAVDSSVTQYKAHMALASLNSNKRLMSKIREYTVERDAEAKNVIKNNVSSLLGNTTEVYTFRLREKDGNQWSDIIYLESESDELRTFSSTYIASRSKKSYRIALGVGE